MRTVSERLRVAEVKRQRDEYISAMKEAGLTIDHKLSTHETVHLQTLLKAPTRTMRILRSFLQQHGINVFESEQDIAAPHKYFTSQYRNRHCQLASQDQAEEEKEEVDDDDDDNDNDNDNDNGQ